VPAVRNSKKALHLRHIPLRRLGVLHNYMDFPHQHGRSYGQPVMLTPNSDASSRKVRKGTKSCWECKRRKIRCIFPPSGEGPCVCCQRRRVPCIGQEIPESLALTKKGNRGLNDRLARIEDAMKGLLASKDNGATPDLTPSSLGNSPTPARVSGTRPLDELL
jgi:hypothetical protein